MMKETADVLRSSLLLKKGVRHAFSLRPHSFVGPAQWLGPSLDHWCLAASLPSPLCIATQVHGRAVYVSDGDPAEAARAEADAVIGLSEASSVGVRTADCVAVLVAARDGEQVAAIHAGWRGVTEGVVAEALAALSFPRDSLVAAIGPAIGPCCFEVSAEVADAIVTASGAAVVVPRTPRPHVDLRKAVLWQLVASGLPPENIELVGGCTRCDEVRYHSHRRDGANAGRMVAAITCGPGAPGPR